MTEEHDEELSWDSGPFCLHWAYPPDCDRMCVCGHPCSEHDRHEKFMCAHENGCPCEGFEEVS